jgi:hypothetical protein
MYMPISTSNLQSRASLSAKSGFIALGHNNKFPMPAYVGSDRPGDHSYRVYLSDLLFALTISDM